MTDTNTAPSSDAATPTKNRRARQALALVLVILLILLGLSSYLFYNSMRVPAPVNVSGTPTDTKGIEWVRSIYGTSDQVRDLFGQTQVAAPANDGTIWVTDVTHPSSLMHFGPDGRYLGALQSVDASRPITSPSRVAVGPDGKIYIVETALDRIHVMTPDGKDAGTFSVPQPVSVAVNSDRIVVGAVSGFAVLDLKGKPMGVVGSRGKGPEQFDYVHGVAFGSDGAIFVSDSYNNRLSAYEPDGKLRWMIRTGAPSNSAELTNNLLTSKTPTDTVLKGSDTLQLPLGLTVDGAGRVVVADMYESALAVFDGKTGKFIGKYGDVGAEDGKFFYPVSVGYDSSRDWFTVADALNRRVQIVRLPGSSAGAAQTTSAVARTLASPLRACLLPLLLIILAIIGYIVLRIMRRRRQTPEAQPES